jgi:hypothetical protein
MKDVVERKTSQLGLPDDFGDNLMKGIEDTRSTMLIGAGGGKPFMRLLRTGQYVWGQTSEPLQEGSHWAINLATLERGWVCWGDGELLGQVMQSVQVARPPRPPSIDGVAFEEQYSFEMTCIDGDDAGTEVLYKNNSLGFKKAFDQLISDVRARYATDPAFYWPIVELDKSSYPHKKYGQIFEPILTIVGWANAGGELAPKSKAVNGPQPEPEVAAARPRKAPLKPATPPGEPARPAEPVSTQQAHVGQRRRPASR